MSEGIVEQFCNFIDIKESVVIFVVLVEDGLDCDVQLLIIVK